MVNAEKDMKENLVYSGELQAVLDGLDDDDSVEENVGMGGKKRRLSVEQVHALEKVFEVDNKLDPERKVKIARELGLQPRQVAIWFQNRRARYKTKQMERDYNLLKANYETLQLNYIKVEQEKEGLIAEVYYMSVYVVLISHYHQIYSSVSSFFSSSAQRAEREACGRK